ncbi:hypothetical protein C479_01471 [Halovivax asiaticus JCM 14624]|uniref:DUF63 domain-containing protein n=1 Tax=Halovivax asiaticus JCM 14624 TaxID=1227490 RepID=M0BSV5_9EURY|nr:DUF63 family protein [Halovivax asiaticus]ELZ13473.1 hypothetical protein C479_01471 [Halovivax asiaticus JCM 14624]
MQQYIDRFGAERIWAATVVVVFGGLALLAALFPQQVYVEFIWEYFWGPVVADANGWNCVAWAGGEVQSCDVAGSGAGPTASPGYTVTSYAGYIPTLLLLLTGFIFVIDRLDIERYRAGFWGLFPFMLFGGALRAVEDANVKVAEATGDAALSLPWQALLISPFTYVVVAVIALVSLVIAVWLERTGVIPGYEYGLAGIGTSLLAVTLVILWQWAAIGGVGFFPLITVTTLVVASTLTALVWFTIQRFAPELNEGTRYMGVLIIWAHAIDGVANVIGLDWAQAFGLPWDLTPKHPVNAAVQRYTGQLLPESITGVIGDVWPFLLLKVAAAVFIIWVFNEEVFEESPRFTIMLMLTVVAVGLGPGTRDMLRATFGV